jgi:hypothetical protein
MNNTQPISEVAIIILEDIDKHLEQVNNLNSIADMKTEISEVRNLISKSLPILELLEKLHKKQDDSK